MSVELFCNFEVSSNFEEEFVAERCSQIVTGVLVPNAKDETKAPFWDEDEKKWQLDAGNNYWLSKTGKNTFQLRSRYAGDVLPTLKPWLEYIFR